MSARDTPTGVLREEHRLILKVADCLERLADQREPDLVAWRGCVVFLRGFADTCHHGKEEDGLFEALAEAGVPRDEGPVAVMLEEHRNARSLVRAMGRELDAAPLDDDALARLRAAGRDYVALIREHIAKEDGGLFEMADSLLDAPACARVCDHYERSCAGSFDGYTIQQLRDLAAALVATVPFEVPAAM